MKVKMYKLVKGGLMECGPEEGEYVMASEYKEAVKRADRYEKVVLAARYDEEALLERIDKLDAGGELKEGKTVIVVVNGSPLPVNEDVMAGPPALAECQSRIKILEESLAASRMVADSLNEIAEGWKKKYMDAVYQTVG